MIKIKNFEDYLINENGLVVNAKTNKIVKVSLCDSGYPKVNLYVNKKIVSRRLHRLIAETFIPNPMNYVEVNHINGIKTDYSIKNLEWCNRSQNIKHAFDIGLSKKIARRKTAVINIENGIFYDTVKEAADSIGMRHQTLANRLCGHRKNNTNFRYA